MFKYRVIGYHKDDLIYGGANMTIYTLNISIARFVIIRHVATKRNIACIEAMRNQINPSRACLCPEPPGKTIEKDR